MFWAEIAFLCEFFPLPLSEMICEAWNEKCTGCAIPIPRRTCFRRGQANMAVCRGLRTSEESPLGILVGKSLPKNTS